MNNTNHTIDTHYLLRHAARAAVGNTDSLWRIASASDLFGKNLDLTGDLTQEQAEAVKAFTKDCLMDIATKVTSLSYIEATNFEIAYSYFVGGERHAC